MCIYTVQNTHTHTHITIYHIHICYTTLSYRSYPINFTIVYYSSHITIYNAYIPYTLYYTTQLIACLEAGAHFVSSNLPQLLTNKHMAINWTGASDYKDRDKDKESAAIQQANIISDSNAEITLDSKKRPAADLTTTATTSIDQQEQQPLKKQKLTENIITAGHSSDPSSYCLDMSDVVYFRDRAPLMPGCKCLACRYIYMHDVYKPSYLIYLCNAVCFAMLYYIHF